MVTLHALASIYSRAHNLMRNADGLQPQEAFDELLKYLFFREMNEEHGPVLEEVQTTMPRDRLFLDDHEDTARIIKGLLPRYIDAADGWSRRLWRDEEFHLSDKTLSMLHRMFEGVIFSQIPFDIRSAAIKEFLPPGIRRGLGIYLTPDDVVSTMVEFVAPSPGEVVYDPACGSGTFLVETLKRWPEGVGDRAVWGADINPRMLLLADLNLRIQGVLARWRRVWW